MISTVAAGSGDDPARVMFLVLMGLVIVGGLTLTVVRTMRSRKPRETQIARLVAELDGRSRVYLRMMEVGLDHRDLLQVAQSRGYSLIVHQVGKYYEFVYTPQQPGRSVPWAI
ncbi:hypothetical protein H4696_007223 [Amycolatopsis lexingtonensis]|uniref:Uncharacterized protein n=1 Tax=Amycolatopsis lexingtonensis TaxID=218822 RepID=A0ABR9IAF5_9PSEU|nr:hypothetical protein [Amycolatopsis lexingtonensis]MBE1500123.1 hypothetical protein [Amycolatopsis lexingtonensis]